MAVPNMPGRDDGSATELAGFLAGKGALRASEAILCALCWIEESTSATATRPSDITSLYPRHAGRRIGSASQALRHHADRGLAEPLGDGRYRSTPLGRLVADALPDRAEVARLRGLRSATPGARPASLR